MNDYFTYTTLLGLRDSNPTPFKETRLQHYKSVQKMVDLISIAKRLIPETPHRFLLLDMYDRKYP